MNIRYVCAVVLMVWFSSLSVSAGEAVDARGVPTTEQVASLRGAIEDLTATFGGRYPGGKAYLGKVSGIERRMGQVGRGEIAGIKADFLKLQRLALIANPLVSGRPILFVNRLQYRSDHHNTATMFVTGEINTRSFKGGGALKAVDLGRPGAVTTLIETATGLIRDPEVRFDGRKVVFAMRKDIKDDYHIYEINADGTGIKQLTSALGVADFDPLYTPDGSIVFSSTREPKFAMCNRHIMGNLFRMDADGANIHQIGKSTLHEGHGALLRDGRIVYDRWEYVDRNFGDAQGLWAVNPDGTNHCVYWGNNTWSPGAAIDARAIPMVARRCYRCPGYTWDRADYVRFQFVP